MENVKDLEECGDIFGAAPDSDPRNRFPDELTATFEKIPLDFCKDIKSFDTEASVRKSHLERSVRISLSACFLGIVTPLCHCKFTYQKLSHPVIGLYKYSFPNQTVDRRTQKLGAYFRAVMRIEQLVGSHLYRNLAWNIEFKEVSPGLF